MATYTTYIPRTAAEEWELLLGCLRDSASSSLPGDEEGQLDLCWERLKMGPAEWPIIIHHLGTLLRWGRACRKNIDPFSR